MKLVTAVTVTATVRVKVSIQLVEMQIKMMFYAQSTANGHNYQGETG